MYNSKKYKAMADKSAEKERLFNEWFTASYDRLRGTLRRYGMLDEDNFHDTYLFVRRQVLVPGKDITDYDAYFIGCYKKAALVKIKREKDVYKRQVLRWTAKSSSSAASWTHPRNFGT